MDTNRICRISARLFFLASIGFAVYWGFRVPEKYDTAHNICFQQMQEEQIHGYITYNQFYYCLDTRTGEAYSPKNDPEPQVEFDRLVREKPNLLIPANFEWVKSTAIEKSMNQGVERNILVGHWEYKVILEIIATCLVLIVISYPTGFYTMKLLIGAMKKLTK